MFGDEIMVADSVLIAKFSRMTLAVAKDSGWFHVEMDKADEFYYGESKGCKMLGHSLDNANETDDTYCYYLSTESFSDNLRFVDTCETSIFLPSQTSKRVHLSSCYEKAFLNDFSQFNPKHDFVCHKMKVDKS